jgi:hypothetical protein
MKKTKLNQAFEMFLGNDEMRPILNNPFILNGYTYATDSNVLIRTKNENIDFKFENKAEGKTPNAETLFKEKTLNKVMDFSGLDFESLKTADELIDSGEDIACEECEGEGEVEWKFEQHTNKFECPICDGSGFKEETKRIKSGNKTFESNTYLKINNSFFYINIFYKLMKCAKLVGGDIVLTNGVQYSDPMIFEVGNCELMICPVNDSSRYSRVYKYPFNK